MKQGVSIFIMDVSNSSANNNWNEISKYLQMWERQISHWCKEVIPAKVSHRRGDEILFVGKHYFSAYTLAHTIYQHWQFDDQRPYFGLSFGVIDEDLSTLDIEIWNHPLIKKAKQANNSLKLQKNRTIDMHFKHTPLNNMLATEDTLNLLLEHQFTLLHSQSPNQRIVCALHSILEEQKRIALLLNKTQPTISTHYHRGHCHLISKTFKHIQKILVETELRETNSDENMLLLLQELNQSIAINLQDNISSFYLFE